MATKLPSWSRPPSQAQIRTGARSATGTTSSGGGSSPAPAAKPTFTYDPAKSRAANTAAQSAAGITGSGWTSTGGVIQQPQTEAVKAAASQVPDGYQDIAPQSQVPDGYQDIAPQPIDVVPKVIDFTNDTNKFTKDFDSAMSAIVGDDEYSQGMMSIYQLGQQNIRENTRLRTESAQRAEQRIEARQKAETDRADAFAAETQRRADIKKEKTEKRAERNRKAQTGMLLASMAARGVSNSSFGKQEWNNLSDSLAESLNDQLGDIDDSTQAALFDIEQQRISAVGKYEDRLIDLDLAIDTATAEGAFKQNQLLMDFGQMMLSYQQKQEEVKKAKEAADKKIELDYYKLYTDLAEKGFTQESIQGVADKLQPGTTAPTLALQPATGTAGTTAGIGAGTGGVSGGVAGVDTESALLDILGQKGLSGPVKESIREAFENNIKNAKTEQDVIDAINTAAEGASGRAKDFVNFRSANIEVLKHLKALQELKNLGYTGRVGSLEELKRWVKKKLDFDDTEADKESNRFLQAVGRLSAEKINDLYAGNVTGGEFKRANVQFPTSEDMIDEAIRKASDILEIAEGKLDLSLKQARGIPPVRQTIQDRLGTVSKPKVQSKVPTEPKPKLEGFDDVNLPNTEIQRIVDDGIDNELSDEEIMNKIAEAEGKFIGPVRPKINKK